MKLFLSYIFSSRLSSTFVIGSSVSNVCIFVVDLVISESLKKFSEI